MSGYKTEDGTDLDNIFYVNNSDANINDDFLIEGKTGTGRYLERISDNTADSANDTGYIINGVDFNRIYALQSDFRVRNYLLRGEDGNRGDSRATHGTIGKGADVKFTITLQKGCKVYIYKVSGGDDIPNYAHSWIGGGGEGGDAIYCNIGQQFLVYRSGGLTVNYSNLIAIAGGGGGTGGFNTTGNLYNTQGGAGGNAGIGALTAASDSSDTGVKYWPGSNGGIRSVGSKHPGNQDIPHNYRLPSGGYDSSTTILKATYAVQDRGTAYSQYYGPEHTGTPEGTTANANYDNSMRGTAGSGGGGWQGGQAGVTGTTGNGVEVTGLGGGGGSSAIRLSNYPQGVISVTLTANVQHDMADPASWENYQVISNDNIKKNNALWETIS